MELNHAWSLLSRRVQVDGGRKVTSGKFQENPKVEFLHQLMVPTTDDVFSARCTEQLLQVVLESSLKQSLLEQDPLNTYSYPVLAMTENVYSVSNPTSLTITVLNENFSRTTWGERNFSVKVLPSLMKTSVSSSGIPTRVVDFTMTDRLSSKIELFDKLFLRMFGTLPGSDFMLSVVYNQKFNRSLKDVLEDASTADISWKNDSLFSLYRNNHNSVEKVAALTMNLYGMLSDANG